MTRIDPIENNKVVEEGQTKYAKSEARMMEIGYPDIQMGKKFEHIGYAVTPPEIMDRIRCLAKSHSCHREGDDDEDKLVECAQIPASTNTQDGIPCMTQEQPMSRIHRFKKTEKR